MYRIVKLEKYLKTAKVEDITVSNIKFYYQKLVNFHDVYDYKKDIVALHVNSIINGRSISGSKFEIITEYVKDQLVLIDIITLIASPKYLYEQIAWYENVYKNNGYYLQRFIDYKYKNNLKGPDLLSTLDSYDFYTNAIFKLLYRIFVLHGILENALCY
jgi:hypothetical protein